MKDVTGQLLNLNLGKGIKVQYKIVNLIQVGILIFYYYKIQH